ncbi:hypothetical protein [Rhizobium leguminosarum]|uniref:hypothetical protein n=1 Tax=Rhizobium leguminosarum TaxID=384 RepID=UPI0011D136D2|nr:hypothetical protein [Rhizobium leguminosarum]
MRYAPMLHIARGGVLSKSGRQRHQEIAEGLRNLDPQAAEAAMQGDIADAARPIRDRLSA